MRTLAGDTALWRHMQAQHGFEGWTRRSVTQAYDGETIQDIHQRDHSYPGNVRHEHRIGSPLAPESTMP